MHVDFYQVEMAEKMKVKVPIVLVGESPATSEKENTIVQTLDELSIECLPGNIPDHIEVDISSLTPDEEVEEEVPAPKVEETAEEEKSEAEQE